MDEKQSNFTKQQKVKKYNEKLISADSTHDINKLFEKYFVISNAEKDSESYTLPKSEFMFKEPPWSLDSLQKLKNDLNQVKSCLNDFNLDEWHKHTNQMNKAGSVKYIVKKYINPELLTQAWLKFYEIASKFPLVPLNEICHENLPITAGSFRSVHLCEAPGAFVAALNHWLATNTHNVKWDWLANSLNPYWEENPYECMIADDRFIKHTLQHWCFGEDNTGDIMKLNNLDDLVKRVSSFDADKRLLLVTADGSIDCTNVPEEQESILAQLHLCETVACMHILQKNGNFLLKLFTLFEHQSVCLMYLLSCAFHEVTVIKPATSKGGNSETYVFCRKFRGKDYMAAHLDILRQHYGKAPPENAMFSQKDIPQSFVQRIEECSVFFKNHQCHIIEDNIKTYHAKNYNILFNVKQLVAMQYIRNCKLDGPLNDSSSIVGCKKIKKVPPSWHTYKKLHVESYNERCQRHNLEESLLLLWKQIEWISFPTNLRSYTWRLRILPESVEIQTGKSFTKVRSSRFSDVQCLNVLNTLDTIIVRETGTTICFPSANLTREQQEDPNQEILNFQFVPVFDNHKTIIEICDRFKKLRTGQALTLVGYSLLTQLNVGLLYLLGNCFDKVVVTICDNEGYHIRLETYQPNEKVSNILHEILAISNSEQNKHKAVWSIIPGILLEECDEFPTIMELNHLMIKKYLEHVMKKCKGQDKIIIFT
ncbi:cap-specific mRNA (nucleoside-2'-O-)-methyltransferase 2 isoform X3 [Pseudomyrmex gracilis]|nr:cap-specific mRNA (nucleoside-2'-O-)-methyltransferase 2 isoform X3 [Pseudomyrmex gracilis]XP_020279450.1 cap-specific mRNA (nucleoside-2'-O-)-methyltransferase 2 isoform X3 [Pseudomyrmex gracilis]XP_020279451.1 cap-specific mRNA (nucleoside-2'-O-)-methyltransferase 2 isoform X3 [Pseudomyrmex gracilis]